MRDHTDYKTRITIRLSQNRHVRKRFPRAYCTTDFSGRCYHVGVFYNKQASPEMYDALLAFRVDIHDDIFSRAMAAANKILSRYPDKSPAVFLPSHYMNARDSARYDRLRAIMLRRMRRYTTALNNSSRLYSHAFPRVA